MKKSLGILGIFLAVCIVASVFGQNFLTGYNLMNLTQRTSLFAIISLGAGLVIITGGIDLSIGSVVCLAGITTPWLLVEHGWSPWAVIPVVLIGSALIGLFHGVLITRLRLQPFLVTLCGLLLYRGVARWMTSDQSQGFQGEFSGVRSIALAKFPIPGLDTYQLPATVMLSLFSLAGIPPLAGFFGKFFLFTAAAKQGYYILVLIALINTIISLYYYLLVIKAMLLNNSDQPIARFTSDGYTRIGLLMCVAGMVIIGFASSIYEVVYNLSYGLY